MAVTLPLSDGHFLPRLVSIFFAVFHPTDGPKVLYQVPEGSITEEEASDQLLRQEDEPAVAHSKLSAAVAEAFENDESLEGHEDGMPSGKAVPGKERKGGTSRDQSPAPAGDRAWKRAAARSRSRDPRMGSRSSSRAPFNGENPTRPKPKTSPLFDFGALSDYLIPKAPLCGRLVTCTTPGLQDEKILPVTEDGEASPSRLEGRTSAHGGYKILGHPMTITSPKYARNMLVYNLCFVFEGGADVRAYEPIVRKYARVLRDLEVRMDRVQRGVGWF